MHDSKSEKKTVVSVPAYGVVSSDPELHSIEDLKKLFS